VPRLKLRAAAVLTVVGLIAACDSGSRDHDPNYFVGPNNGNSNLGQLTVSVSDAPPDFGALRTVNIEIDRIEAIGTIGSEQATLTLFDARSAAPIAIVPPPQTIDGAAQPNTGPQIGPQRLDVFALRGGPTAQVAQVFLPPGRIDQLRVFLSGAEVTMAGFNTPATQVFSTTNGRLSLNGLSSSQPIIATITSAIVITPGAQQGVLLDFDLASSLEATGDPLAPTGIVFTPVVHARPISDTSLAGVIRTDNGTATNTGDDFPLANARITLFDGDQVVGVTTTDSQGVFRLTGVPQGTLDLLAVAANHTQQRVPITFTGGNVTRDLLLAAALVQQSQ
jgi:hypothetical protein